ncbi:MAG: toast rack family protein [candidate division WOR-3 bacterium]|nr:toast rack family protein [candidate division WOR-3 bacterium]
MSRRLSVSLVTAGIMLAAIGCRAPASKVPGVTSIDKKVEPGRVESTQVSAAGTGKLNIMDRKVELGRAESTQVSVAIGIGKLNISGGAKGLLDARFEYEIPDWKPEVIYEVEDGFGRLAVKQPDSKVGAKTDVRYDWNLKLSGKVPTDLVVEMGTGKVDIDARGLNLRHLKVAGAVGEARIDLSDVSTSLNADVEAGFGKLKLVVPSAVGVRVKVDGIGQVEAADLSRNDKTWTNAAWGKSKVSVDVNVSGIGEVEIESVAKQGI